MSVTNVNIPIEKSFAGKDVGEKEKIWPQVLAILIVCLSSFTSGALFVWSSPSIVKIVNDNENYNISEDEAAYFTFIPAIGMILFSFAFFNLNDFIGRKKTILCIAIPHITAWLLIAFAKSVYVFYLSRLISGIADAAAFASIPMYLGEVATPSVRGSWGNTFTTSIYIGQLCINIVGSYCSIQTTAFVFVLFPIAFAILMFFMPETPYYYLMKGNVDKARSSLRFLRRRENVEEELEDIKAAMQRQMSEPNTWKDLFTIISNRRALFCGFFLRYSQQLAGISAFVTFNQLFFSKAGGNVGPEVSSIIYCALIAMLNISASFTLDRFGRKKSFLFSISCCTLCLYLESAFLYIDEFTDADVTNWNWVPLTMLILFCIFGSFGISIVPTLMMSELFSASIKGKALCVLNMGFGVVAIFSMQLFHVLMSNVGLFSPFLFYAICSTISSVLTVFFIPETKGKTLEEIQQVLRGNK